MWHKSCSFFADTRQDHNGLQAGDAMNEKNGRFAALGADGKNGWRLAVLAIVLLAGAGGYWVYSREVWDSQAVVDGQEHVITAGAEGRVADVPVSENQRVKAGDILVRLDDTRLKTQLAEARAGLEALRLGFSPEHERGGPQQGASAEQAIMERIQTARKAETEARRNLEHLTIVHAQALLELRRLDTLSGSYTPSMGRRNAAQLSELEARGNMDAARDAFETASRTRAAADADLRRYRNELNQYQKVPQQLRAGQLDIQEARVHQAEQNLAAATLVAPVDGQVTRLAISSGETVQRGQTIATVTPVRPGDLWITAHVPDSKLDRFGIGTPCSISFPSYGSFELSGSVAAIDRGSEPHGQTSSEALVRIAIPDYDPDTMPALKIGMRAKVRINPIL